MEHNLHVFRAPNGERMITAPLTGESQGRLIFPHGTSNLTIWGEIGLDELFEARFSDRVTAVDMHGGVVTVKHPHRIHLLDWRRRAGEIGLNTLLPWNIEMRGSASCLNANLRNIILTGIKITRGASVINLELPRPEGTVPIHINGGACDVVLQRPD